MNWEQLGSAAEHQLSKTPILHLSMNWQKLYPNLNFTIENKIGILHKIRLFEFQT